MNDPSRLIAGVGLVALAAVAASWVAGAWTSEAMAARQALRNAPGTSGAGDDANAQALFRVIMDALDDVDREILRPRGQQLEYRADPAALTLTATGSSAGVVMAVIEDVLAHLPPGTLYNARLCFVEMTTSVGGWSLQVAKDEAGQIPGVTAPVPAPPRRARYGPTDASLIGKRSGMSDYDLLRYGYDAAGIRVGAAPPPMAFARYVSTNASDAPGHIVRDRDDGAMRGYSPHAYRGYT